ncbi:MAG: YraN family protein [Phycisphaerales bacterium]|nr:YraN family protein [Phycisphaerales bacterium]
MSAISAKRIGFRGEQAVSRYLRWRGWRILGRNVRIGRDELDLVAAHRKDSILAVVEVKSSVGDACLLHRVDHQKQCRVARAAERLPAQWVRGRALRFDVAAVRVRRIKCQVRYLEAAFDDPR